jgi:hypothetical protein
MNTAFLQMDETGIYVEGAGFAPALGDGMLPVPAGLRPEALLGHYIAGGVLVPRPRPPVPVEISGGWRLAACPAGTQVLIHDLAGREVIFQGIVGADGEDFDFVLPDAGQYMVEVDAPLPFVDTKTIIEVV